VREDWWMPALLFALFVVTPLVELYVLIQVGQIVGTLPTIVALLVISVVGAALVKAEGLRAWIRFRDALQEARLPAKEVVDGALLLLAGALLLTPGFVTDGIGLLCLLPPSRAVINRALRSRVRASLGLGLLGGPDNPGGRTRHDGALPTEDLDVEVVDVRRTEPEDREELGGGD
jgi:UPF0716 protein FxsA